MLPPGARPVRSRRARHRAARRHVRDAGWRGSGRDREARSQCYPALDSRLMTVRVAPQLRYLTAADVVAAMPPLAERLRLAELTMTALVHDAELPPKIGVHPESPGSFAHAMPAALRAGGGPSALLGMKWVTGYLSNNQLGLP